MSWSAMESEPVDMPKTSLKWEEKASKELIIVVCEFQMARAQSNARPVSREGHFGPFAGKPLGLQLYVERNLE